MCIERRTARNRPRSLLTMGLRLRSRFRSSSSSVSEANGPRPRRVTEENRGRGRLDAVQPRSTTVERPADQHFSIGGGASKSGSKSGSQIARIDEGGSDSDRDSDFAALHEVAADTLRIMANGPAARLTACCCHVNVFTSPEHQALRPDNSEKNKLFPPSSPPGRGSG